MLYNKTNVDNIGRKLLDHKLTIAVAESVTSGHLQAALSLAPDASRFFQGGITAYNIGQKCRHLLVEPTHAIECDCVSEKVAADMAIAIARLFSSDYGIGITGYATTKPEAGINELFAYISIIFKGETLIATKITPIVTDSMEVQIDYVNQVLKSLDSLLK
jgi:nicotinamide-nucleotide amidase